jgi:DNA-binding PadR family transcriptional regulator
MPMPDSHVHVLLVLAEGDAHGYRIMHAIDTMTAGAFHLRPGVLYAALGRLADAGLIVETDRRPAAELDDQRRRYYRITSSGRQALGAEIDRLSRLVGHAKTLNPAWGCS